MGEIVNQRLRSISLGTKRHTKLKAVIAVAIVVVIAGACDPVPLPNGYYRYAEDQQTPYLQLVKSPLVTNIKGGRVAMNGVGVQINLYIRTFSEYPGYATHGSASGFAPGYITLSHSAISQALSGCYWGFPSDVGPAPLTCDFQI